MAAFNVFITGPETFCNYIEYEKFSNVLDVLLSNKKNCEIVIHYSQFVTKLTKYIEDYSNERKIKCIGTMSSSRYISHVQIDGLIIFSRDGMGSIAGEVSGMLNCPKRIIKLDNNERF